MLYGLINVEVETFMKIWMKWSGHHLGLVLTLSYNNLAQINEVRTHFFLLQIEMSLQ